MGDWILRCQIEDLAKLHPWLFLEPHIVACAAVLLEYGESPAVFHVSCSDVESARLGGATEFNLTVAWSAKTAEKAERLRATVQSKPLVEMASTALALVLAHHVIRLGQLDVTNYGDRTDFRSLKDSCMLEISGTETFGELSRRHREKVAQAMANPLGWDVYVVVCAFSGKGHRIRFSFHQAKEAANG